MIEAYPLQWPEGYPRTNYPQCARFDTTFAIARDEIVRELKRFGATNVIISTNVPLRNDGLPYANFKPITDKGVAVYFLYDKRQVVLACDKWNKIEHNMQAIRKAIEALRGLDRWGVSDMLNRVFTGFVALPESIKKRWWEVLDISKMANTFQINEAYRKKAKETHPDKPGGSHDNFIEVEEAYRTAIAEKEKL